MTNRASRTEWKAMCSSSAMQTITAIPRRKSIREAAWALSNCPPYCT